MVKKTLKTYKLHTKTFRQTKTLVPKYVFSSFLAIILFVISIFSPFVVSAEKDEDYIRMAWAERSHINPLNTFDESGRAIMPLVYRGLFVIDNREMLRTDLAAKAEWSLDHYSLAISVRKDESFSNRQRLTAYDVALSILYYRYYLEQYLSVAADGQVQFPMTDEGEIDYDRPSPGLASPIEYLYDLRQDPGLSEQAENNQTFEDEYVEDQDINDLYFDEQNAFTIQDQVDHLYSLRYDPFGLESLRAIRQIDVLSDQQLVIRLSHRAERLPWYLTHPIIPADQVEEFDQPIEGIGTYRFVEKNEELILEPIAQGLKSQAKIKIKSYPNFNRALFDFTEGRLDLLYVGPEDFLNLNLRRDLKSVRQQTNRYYFLKCGFSLDYPFAEYETQELFRQALVNSPESNYISVNLPLLLHERDWRRDFSRQGVQGWPEQNWLKLKEKLGDRPITLAAVSNTYNRYLVDGIREFFMKTDIPITVKWVLEENFSDFASTGNYDFLLCNVDMSWPVDIHILRQELYDLSPYLAFSLPTAGDQGLISVLFDYGWNLEISGLAESALETYYTNLEESLRNSGIFEVFFAEQGVLIGDRIKGRLSSPAWDVYRNIQELDIWD